MARHAALLAASILVGCTSSHIEPADAASGPTDAGARPRPDSGPRDPDVEPPPGAVVCGGIICAAGEECCLLTASCVPVGDSSCRVPGDTPIPDACARDSDCAEGQLCGSPDADDMWMSMTYGQCGAIVGRCFEPRGPELCSGSFPVCGCDGRTYDDPCAASRALTRVGRVGACGTENGYRQLCDDPDGCFSHAHCDLAEGVCVREDAIIACGIDAQCPEHALCCGITGTCYDASRPELCTLPPEGTEYPCAGADDCARYDGSYWSFSGPAPGRTFCGGPGCGPIGGCMEVPRSCDGILEPVCGCDERTYQNACEAARARVRVLHDGAC